MAITPTDVAGRATWRRRVASAVACALVAVVGAMTSARPAAASSPHVLAFRGLGTWVDIYDGGARADPEAAVAQMHAQGVRTLYLETSNFAASAAIVSPISVSRFIVAAHRVGMRVVAWYLPSFARPARDSWRALRALRFRTEDGQGFDAFALDIESTRVRNVTVRNTRLLQIMAAIRKDAGDAYPLGAIVPAPAAMRMRPDYWPGFPFRRLRSLVNAFLPMDYFTYHVSTADAAHAYTVANVNLLRRWTGDPGVPIHLVGGEAGSASTDEVVAFAHAEREQGVLGASLYDFATTTAAAWSDLAGVPANPPQRPPLPLALPQTAALGNIPDGDRTHPKEIFYRVPALSGVWAVRYRGFDLQADEVQLWVNWVYVRTLGPAAPGGWSPWRAPTIPAGLIHPAAPTLIQFVAVGEYPVWSVWGVRGVSLIRPTAVGARRSQLQRFPRLCGRLSAEADPQCA